MARLTVTLDENVSQVLDDPDVDSWREAVHAFINSESANENDVFYKLAGRIGQLGSEPSASAVMRQAVAFFLDSINEASDSVRTEEGYAALARDAERSRAATAMRTRVPERFAED